MGIHYFPDILTDKEKKLIDSVLIVIDSLVYNYPEEKYDVFFIAGSYHFQA